MGTHTQACTLRKYAAYKHTPTHKIGPCVLNRQTPLLPKRFVFANTDGLRGGGVGGWFNDNTFFYRYAQGVHCGLSCESESVLHYNFWWFVYITDTARFQSTSYNSWIISTLISHFHFHTRELDVTVVQGHQKDWRNNQTNMAAVVGDQEWWNVAFSFWIICVLVEIHIVMILKKLNLNHPNGHWPGPVWNRDVTVTHHHGLNIASVLVWPIHWFPLRADPVKSWVWGPFINTLNHDMTHLEKHGGQSEKLLFKYT